MRGEIPLNIPLSNPRCLTRTEEQDEGMKGLFLQTPPMRDRRDGDGGAIAQREFCVILDLKLESPRRASYKYGPHCVVEFVCGVHSSVWGMATLQ